VNLWKATAFLPFQTLHKLADCPFHACSIRSLPKTPHHRDPEGMGCDPPPQGPNPQAQGQWKAQASLHRDVLHEILHIKVYLSIYRYILVYTSLYTV
jgi:hypothetical protein